MAALARQNAGNNIPRCKVERNLSIFRRSSPLIWIYLFLSCNFVSIKILRTATVLRIFYILLPLSTQPQHIVVFVFFVTTSNSGVLNLAYPSVFQSLHSFPRKQKKRADSHLLSLNNMDLLVAYCPQFTESGPTFHRAFYTDFLWSASSISTVACPISHSAI